MWCGDRGGDRVSGATSNHFTTLTGHRLQMTVRGQRGVSWTSVGNQLLQVSLRYVIPLTRENSFCGINDYHSHKKLSKGEFCQILSLQDTLILC